MNRKHKYLSLILALAVAFGMMPLMAYADDQDISANTDTISVAVPSGDLNTDAESADPDAGVSLAEEGYSIITVKKSKDYSFYPMTVDDPVTNTSNFYVKTPEKGLLTLAFVDSEGNPISYCDVKTKKFKDYEHLSFESPLLDVGVKKGTYQFTAKPSVPSYYLAIKFTKLSESKYGSSKKKAAVIKKNKKAKGLFITDSKKVHWYKIKHTNTKAIKVYIKPTMSKGGSYGGYTVTIYKGSAKVGPYTEQANSNLTVSLYNLGNKSKLAKGTYYVKVQSYNGGNGSFTVKWK